MERGRARPRAGLGGQDDRDLPHLRDARRQRPAAGAADPADQRAALPGSRRGVISVDTRSAEDRQTIHELVQNWAIWRDAGDWERFATVWHDEGQMMATW